MIYAEVTVPMSTHNVLILFLILRLAQHFVESWLAKLNYSYWNDSKRQDAARVELGISEEDMAKSAAYTQAKYRFGRFRASLSILLLTTFVGFGGLGMVESVAISVAQSWGMGSIMTGVLFFGMLLLLAQIASIPFALYNTFVIEEQFGFNKQTIKGFVVDLLKGLALTAVFGGPLIAAILWIMERMGNTWWIWAWAFMSAFSIIAAWLYPTFLAPLFNKFKPLDDGELKTRIHDLAKKIGFGTDGIFVMDASKRSSHGNAYFTGVFGKKRIVLFDTLLSDMSPSEVVAVLAHELGHFKLHHVRDGIFRGLATSFVVFFLISLMLPHSIFYEAFGLSDITNYGGLIVFSLWFSVVEFLTQPLETRISRRNEFAADGFAKENIGNSDDMIAALKKLREKSFVMPISHPIYSAVYYSHPPMLERLRSLRT